MKRRYLDDKGLGKVFKLLKDGLRSKPSCKNKDGDLVNDQNIVELTKAEYDALATKDPDTYYMINDDDETSPSNFWPKPDWANAVTLTTAQLNAGYAAPADGMFFGNAAAVNNTRLQIYVGGIRYVNIDTSTSSIHNSAEVCVPVGHGDIIKASNLTDSTVSFVPWK